MAVALKTDLIGYWNLNDKSGASAEDSSGNGNDGTLEGTANPSWEKGVSGTCLEFDVDERVDMANPAPLDDIGLTHFSISFWMKSRDNTPFNEGCIFSKYVDVSNSIVIRSNGAVNQLNVFLEKTGTAVDANFNAAPFDTDWHHIVVLVDRTNDLILVYLDAVKDTIESDISSLAADITNTGRVSFGARDDGLVPYDGQLDELRIYSRLLNEEEIQFLYDHPAGLMTQDGVTIKIYSPGGVDLVGILSDTDYTGQILDAKVKELEVGGVDSFSFSVQKDLTIPISRNAECHFYVNGSLWFIGYITEIPDKQQDKLSLEIKGLGLVHRLKETIITEDYASQDIGLIIADLGNYLSAIGINYNAFKIETPTINARFLIKEKKLFDAFMGVLKVANNDYNTERYRFYIDNVRDFNFRLIDETVEDILFEGYDFQAPKVKFDRTGLVNRIYMYRADSASADTAYEGVREDTESQAKYGIKMDKMVWPDTIDTATAQSITDSIIEEFKEPKKQIEIENLEVFAPMKYKRHTLNMKRDDYYEESAPTDVVTGWDTANLTVTTFSVSTDRSLTGRRSLKFITAAGGINDYVEYTLDNIVYFPIELRFFHYFVGTAIPFKLVLIDINDAEIEIDSEQITDEWVRKYQRIDLETEEGFLKVTHDGGFGFMKVTHDGGSGFMKIRNLIRLGIQTIKKIRILINSNTVTTFYVDLIEVSADAYGYNELLLKGAEYSLSSRGIFANAAFGEHVDSIMREIDKKAKDGEISLDIWARDV